MNADFLERETQKARERFNQTFGRMTVCDLKLRHTAIICVCMLGIITKRVRKAALGEPLKADVRKFMRARQALNKVFTQLERTQLKQHQSKRQRGCRAKTG